MFRQDFTCPALLKNNLNHLPVRDCHPLWSPFPKRSGLIKVITGLVRVRSPLLAESRLISFPLGNEMFQFPRFAPTTYVFSCQYTLRCGFPHSDISGSKGARASPELIAACYVLHRLSVPRHPPNALVMLDPYQKPNLFGVNPHTIRQGVGQGFDLRYGLTTLISTRDCLRGRLCRKHNFLPTCLAVFSRILDLSRSELHTTRRLSFIFSQTCTYLSVRLCVTHRCVRHRKTDCKSDRCQSSKIIHNVQEHLQSAD